MAEATDETGSKIRLNEALERKTQLEAQALQEQFTPSHRRMEIIKVVIGASGLLAAIATVLGGAMQYFHQREQELQQQERAQQQQEIVQQLRVEERMDRALAQLAEARPTQRAAAVTSLRSFIDSGDRKRNAQVLAAIASALPLEEDGIVRNAMLSAFEDVDAKSVGQDTLDSTLKALVNHNRGLVREAMLWRSRPANLYALDASVKHGSSLQVTARAIVSLLRKGARAKDMSSIYLGRADLTRLDLSGVNFDDSILAWSDFSSTTLIGASFNRADLDTVKFTKANLRDAKLIFQEGGWATDNNTHYALARNDGDQSPTAVFLPDFRCSDLTGADFSGHPVISIKQSRLPNELKYFFLGSGFDGANLSSTKFSNMSAFVIFSGAFSDFNSPLPSLEMGTRSLELGGQTYQIGMLKLAPSGPLGENKSEFPETLESLRYMFHKTNWRNAELPLSLRQWLESVVIDELAPDGREEYCRNLPL